MNARLLFLHALSPLHAGVGQGVGVIDLPLAREKSTGIPYVPGSSVKGVLRASCEDRAQRIRIFGPETDNASDHAGAAQFSDLTLLCMPVRSLYGSFVWMTSPYLLRRLARDMAAVGARNFPIPAASKDGCSVAPGATIVGPDGKVVLEDLDLSRTEDKTVQTWAEWIAGAVFPGAEDWKQAFIAQLAVVHEDIMAFLLETATDVVARIALDEEKKTVKRGALWYEESLPTESILWGLNLAVPIKSNGSLVDAAQVFTTVGSLMERPMQIGGHASVGRGLCQMRMVAP